MSVPRIIINHFILLDNEYPNVFGISRNICDEIPVITLFHVKFVYIWYLIERNLQVRNYDTW